MCLKLCSNFVSFKYFTQAKYNLWQHTTRGRNTILNEIVSDRIAQLKIVRIQFRIFHCDQPEFESHDKDSTMLPCR